MQVFLSLFMHTKKNRIYNPHDDEDSFLCHNCYHESDEDDEHSEEEGDV